MAPQRVPKPRPIPTPDTQFYWDRAAEKELWLPRCDDCGKCFWYPRSHCPVSRSHHVSWVRASGQGRVASFVINHRPHPGYADQGPYVIAQIELEEGIRMMTNLVDVVADPEHVSVGMAVSVVFEDRGEGLEVPQFRPVAP
jgi:uncharacterized OB-fold protein